MLEKGLMIHGKFDLHGHTHFSRFFEFVTLTPREAIRRASELGLTGIAITNHDTFEGLGEGFEAADEFGIILVPGIEILSLTGFSDGFRTPHTLGIGIHPDSVKRQRTPTFKNPSYVMEWIRDQGGKTVIPHPSIPKRMISFCFEETEAYIEKGLVDVVETVNSLGEKQKFRELARKYTIPELGGSDYHCWEQIGLAGTIVDGQPTSYMDVIKAIDDNRVRPYVETYIPPDLEYRARSMSYMGRRLIEAILR